MFKDSVNAVDLNKSIKKLCKNCKITKRRKRSNIILLGKDANKYNNEVMRTSYFYKGENGCLMRKIGLPNYISTLYVYALMFL